MNKFLQEDFKEIIDQLSEKLDPGSKKVLQEVIMDNLVEIKEKYRLYKNSRSGRISLNYTRIAIDYWSQVPHLIEFLEKFLE